MVTHQLFRPHLGSSRKIHPGQKIHSSLMLTDKTRREYTPKARPLDDDPNFWEKAHTTGLGNWLELDLYEYTKTLVRSLGTNECPDNGTALQTLRQTVISGKPTPFFRHFTVYRDRLLADGWQAVYEGVIGTLRYINLETKHRFLHSAMDILAGKSPQGSTSRKLSRSNKIFPLVSDLWKSNIKSDQEVAQRFLLQFTDCK